MIESSGGTKIVHPWIGKHKIERAVSRYGMTPSRVIEVYARSPEFRNSTSGKEIGNIVEPALSKFKTKDFYDTAAFIEKTPLNVQKKLFSQINEITKQKEHDDAIFHASKKHSINNLSYLAKDPAELDIMAAHSHHWFWPRTRDLYEEGGIGAVINDEDSKEGNYIRKYKEHLSEKNPVKQKIEQFLKETPKKTIQLKKKKEPFYGN